MKAMAHKSGLPRGKSWSAGSTTGSITSSGTRWVKSERLKKLEEEASTISSQMKILEAEIRDLSTTFEKLKRFDSKRVEKLRELVGEEADAVEKVASSDNSDTQEGNGVNGEQHRRAVDEAKSETPGVGRFNEEAESLKSEHVAAQSQIDYTKSSLELKVAELEALSGKHQSLTEQIAKEEKLAQSTEIDETLQHSSAVQNDMKSISGRIVDGSKDANGDQVKPTRPQQKPRVYHPITQLRSRNLSRNFQNGGASDLGRSASLGDAPSTSSRSVELYRSKEPIRSKEPAEFEEREGGANRKRQKNSAFEQERLRFREEKAKADLEAKEKRRVPDAASSVSSHISKGNSSARRSSRSSLRDMSSQSSASEGFGDLTPSTKVWLGSVAPATSGSTGVGSDSSDLSSEFSTGRPDSSSFSSAVKRLDFESLANEDSVALDVASRTASEEDLSGDRVDNDVGFERQTGAEESSVAEAGYEMSSVEQGEEVESAENLHEEFQVPAVSFVNRKKETVEPEVDSPETGAEEMEGREASPPKSGADEIERRSEFETVGGEAAELMTPVSGTEEKGGLDVFTPQTLAEDIEDADPEQAKFEREILEVFSEQYGNAWRGTDTDDSVELAETHSLHEVSEQEVKELDMLVEEFTSFSNALRDAEEDNGEEQFREEVVVTTGTEVEEIDVLDEYFEDFELTEAADEIREQLVKTLIGVDEVEMPLGTIEVPADDDGEGEAAIERLPSVQKMVALFEQSSSKSETQTRTSPADSPSKAGQVNGEEIAGDPSERQNRRLEAENQMFQLSSQLSVLQIQVEEEVELHEKSKNHSQLEQTSEEKEQLSKQVSCFADEVRGLRQNIDVIQRILRKEGGELPVQEHWAKDLHSKCADQSAQLEHLGRQVSMLERYLKQQLQLRNDFGEKVDGEGQETQKVDTQLADWSKSIALSENAIIEQQQYLLVDPVKEAELRNEVKITSLNSQIEQLEMACDTSKSILAVSEYQDKAFRQGLQTLVQLFLLALGIVALYSRVAEPSKASLVPT